MLEAGDAIQESLLHPSQACRHVGVPRTAAKAAHPSQRQARELRCAMQIFHPTFVIESELLAGMDGVESVAGRIVHEFMPVYCGGGVVAPPLGEERQLPASLRAKFGGEAKIERLGAGCVGAIGIAAPLQKAREAEQIEAI